MKAHKMTICLVFLLVLCLYSTTIFGQSEDAEKAEKGKLAVEFRITSTPTTERDIYYHVCRLFINEKEIKETFVDKEAKWVTLFSGEMEEGVYDVKVLHGYASKEGKWDGEFSKQPKVFRVAIKKGPDTIIKYSYNVGLISDGFLYDKVPPTPPPTPPPLPKISPEHKPRIVVVIPEQHLQRQRIPDPAAETEVVRKLVENDFWVVDQAQVMEIRYNDESKRALQGDNTAAMAIGKQFDAEVLIIGEAFSQRTDFSARGEVECSARVEARAIRVDTGQILAAHGLTAISVGASEEIASKQALAEAGGKVGDYLIREIARKWKSVSAPSAKVKLTNVDFKLLVLFEQALKEKVKGVQGFHRRNFDIVGKIAEIDVDIEGGAQSLSTELTTQVFPDFEVEVLNFSANALDLRLKPKEATTGAMVLGAKALFFIEQTDPDGTLKKCKVMVLKVNETSLEYNWAVESSDGSSRSGVYMVDAFDKSHDYGVNWESKEEGTPKGTSPWVSKEVYQELRDNGFTIIAVDKLVRKDAIVMAELKGITVFPVDINGRKANLKAIEVSTDKGDKLLILDEAQNPLVLSADVAGRYKSKVTAMYIPGYK